MTIQVDLNPAVEARLTARARAQGVPLEKAAARILEEAVTSGLFPSGDLSIGEFHIMLASLAEGSDRLPNLPTESFTRESYYEDGA